MKSIGMVILAVSTVLLPQLLRAQAQPAVPDTIVQITAEAQGLQMVPSDQLPPFGTFWLMQPRCIGAAPLPCPSDDPTLPVYQIADGQYIVDGTVGQVLPTVPSVAQSILEAQANAVVNLIAQVQAAQLTQAMRLTMGMDSPEPPGGGGDSGGGGDYTNNYSFYRFDTNQLWLEITNVSNGLAYANLHHATNQVYAIWATTNLSLPFALWPVETEIWPTDTNCMPFVVPTLSRNPLFLRAQDWTGVDSDGDGVPDWWIWKYFGNLNQTATNLDGFGNTLGYDYLNGLNPTNPLALDIIWPQDGTHICGSAFTLQARIADKRATVTAQIVDAGGNTNAAQGLVEGTGMVWVNNLPLVAGANTLTITVTGAAGNAWSTRETLYQSSVLVTLNPLTGDQLNQSWISMTGTVSDASANLVVNGTTAMVHSDGTWSADSVPAEPTGTAIFDVEVSGGGSNRLAKNLRVPADGSSFDADTGFEHFAQVQPVTVVLSNYFGAGHYFEHDSDSPDPCNDFTWDESVNWSCYIGGNITMGGGTTDWNCGWGESGSIDLLPVGEGYAPPYFYGVFLQPSGDLTPIWEQSAVTVASAHMLLQRTNQSQVMIVPSGQTLAGTTKLYLVQACASEFSSPYVPHEVFIDANGWNIFFGLVKPVLYAGDVPLPPEWLQINGRTLINSGITNTDGSVWGDTFVSAPAGLTMDVTPTAAKYYTNNDYTFSVLAKELNFLAVDANRDGSITFDQPGQINHDQTTADKPYRFWVNNDYDGYDTSLGDYADLDPATGSDANSLTINCTRDLEDYSRLWINTAGITTELQNGIFLLALEWKDTADDPQMKLFLAAETNGDALYLTDTNVAAQQVNNYGFHVIEWAHRNVLWKNNPFIFPQNFWANANVSTNQPVAHLLFDAANCGSGKLVVSIYKNDGVTKLAESSPLYLKLQDVKEMYESWTVGSDPTAAPATTASVVTTPYQYDSTIPAENNYILFVHGWNLAPWEKDAFAETAFKRLYWQGYKGRFGAFQWPTGYGFASAWDTITDSRNFDNSESNAWASATGLLGKLATLNSTYPNHVYLMAHSMGNVVASESLKLAGSSQVVNTYVAMQGAIPAHCYDPNATTRTIPFIHNDGTPNRYAGYPTNGGACYFNGISGAGTYFNFYNTNDYALNKWTLDQNFKPDNAIGYSTAYGYSSENGFYKNISGNIYELDFPANTYELFAYAVEARCFALGATASVNWFTPQSLSNVWPDDTSTADPNQKYKAHKWHSAEFNFDNIQQGNYWNQLLQTYELKGAQ